MTKREAERFNPISSRFNDHGDGNHGRGGALSNRTTTAAFYMDKLFSVDWAEFFVPTHSIAEVVARGTVMYLSIFLMFRFLLKRQSSSIGLADLLVVVLIADAAQDALTKGYKSVTEGVVLVLTIVFWDFALDWLGYHLKFMSHLTRRPPLLLIEDGRMLRRNMRQEMITKDELLSELREHGLDDASEVKKAFLEGNGQLSVIKRGSKETSKPKANPGARPA
jgi:uncharacterized membrane protein YcaP (DUF421 family)